MLLAKTPDHRIDSALIVRLEQSRDRDERLAIIETLGHRATEPAHEALTKLGSRIAITPTAWALRKAARRALEGKR
jgi:hypothetical protein